MDFEEISNQSHEVNVKKNRATLVALFAIFLLPVLFAYVAFYSGWFKPAVVNRGELLVDKEILDVEDFAFIRKDGDAIGGAEFETLYWWLMPIDLQGCDSDCLDINLLILRQTYLGLGKDKNRINPLLVLPTDEQYDTRDFPVAYSDFSNVGVKALPKTHSGLDKDLPANFIYLVDPLGNIILRYELVRQRDKAPKLSEDLRTDLQHLFKYSRLG